MKEYDFTFITMGCEASITLVSQSKDAATQSYARMRSLAESYDARFSRFTETSELSELNRRRSMIVSPQFMEVFLCALALSLRTRGAFNPLVDISRFGYDADITLVRNTERVRTPISSDYSTDLAALVFDTETRHISLAKGQHLDFGGFLKGFVAEKMARCAEDILGVIANMGGDLYTCGVSVTGTPFVFTVDDPSPKDRDIEFLAQDAAVATSGTYARAWKLNGVPFSHILDASGQKNPESDVISATIKARSGAEADAFAKVPIVRGSSEGERILKQQSLPYCLILDDGSMRISPDFLTYAPPYTPSLC